MKISLAPILDPQAGGDKASPVRAEAHAWGGCPDNRVHPRVLSLTPQVLRVSLHIVMSLLAQLTPG